MRNNYALLCALSYFLGLCMLQPAEAQVAVILKCADIYKAAKGSKIKKRQLYPGGCSYAFEAQLQDKATGEIVFARVLQGFPVLKDKMQTVFQGSPAALVGGGQIVKNETGEQLDPNQYNVLGLIFTPELHSGGTRGLPELGISCIVTSDSATTGRLFLPQYYLANDLNAYIEVATVATEWKCSKVAAPH